MGSFASSEGGKTNKRIYDTVVDGFVNTYRQLMFTNQRFVNWLGNFLSDWPSVSLLLVFSL